MRHGPYTPIPTQPHPPTRTYEQAGRSPTMPTHTAPLPRRTRDLIREAKRRAGPDGSPAHELALMAIREAPRSESILYATAMEWYAEDCEKEIERLRDQLTGLQREITSRVAHSKGCREIAKGRGLIEDAKLPESVEVGP